MSDALSPIWLLSFGFGVALLPVLAGLTTSYVKISVVLGMLRSALGTQQVPSGMVVMALSLGMTFLIMGPVIDSTASKAEAIDFKVVFHTPSVASLKKLSPLTEPWLEFLTEHAGEQELLAMTEVGDSVRSEKGEPESSKPKFGVLVLAFIVTELKEAFTIAFMLLLPFLVIDLIVANILVGMGMFMVSPVLISLPLKLVLFVISDGWLQITRGLIYSYGA